MLQFFEPEAEPRWPVSGAPPDHYECSRMLDDAVFPLRSSSLLNSCGGTNIEPRAGGSGVASELERLNSFNDDFLSITSQDCNSFQLESMNQIAGQASLTVNSMELRVSGLTSNQNLMMDTKRPRKHTITRHQIKKEHTVMDRETKRYKTANGDKQQTPTIFPTSSKAPAATTVKKSQKLGDKITALQQLVSPFGKTDTASVLQEARAFIKLVHEQIRMLSSPYFGARYSPCFLQGNVGEKLSLRGKGLCLVPISSTIMNLTDQEPFDRHSALDRTAWETGVRLS